MSDDFLNYYAENPNEEGSLPWLYYFIEYIDTQDEYNGGY